MQGLSGEHHTILTIRPERPTLSRVAAVGWQQLHMSGLAAARAHQIWVAAAAVLVAAVDTGSNLQLLLCPPVWQLCVTLDAERGCSRLLAQILLRLVLHTRYTVCCCSYCDVLDKDNMARIILENGITHVIHFATLLSGGGTTKQHEQQRLQAGVAWTDTRQHSSAWLQCVCLSSAAGFRSVSVELVYAGWSCRIAV